MLGDTLSALHLHFTSAPRLQEMQLETVVLPGVASLLESLKSHPGFTNHEGDLVLCPT